MMKCTTGWYVIKCLLNAGGNWTNAANCRSRSRNANNGRVNSNTNIGRRSRIQELDKLLAGYIGLPERENTKWRVNRVSRVIESSVYYLK